MKRIEALRRLAFEEKGFDGFLIANGMNQLYFAGFPGTACILIPRTGKGRIYVYGVNYQQAKAKGKEFNVELVKRGEDLAAKIAKEAETSKIKKLAIDTIAGIPRVADYLKLRKAMKEIAQIEIDNESVSELRRVKDEEELQDMRTAAQQTSEGMKVAYEVIKPGIREYEVAAEIEYAMRREGCWGTAFETIVASGVRSAFPHGGCTERKIQKGDLVVVDVGATYQYYRSDMTRTVIAGKPSAKQRMIYRIVKLAQEEAFQAVRSEAEAKEIDGTARKVIEDAGYGECFVHGLGHGVGLEVHESPTLNQESKDTLKIGNVVTIEPGIYMVGFGGIRIEDTVLVHKDKAEKLTKGPYTLETKK